LHINAHRAGFVLGVLMAVQCSELGGRAQALPSVRVIPADAKIFTRPEVISDVVTVTHAGAVLDLIDKREGWYWILLGRDQNGSRRPGWIQANEVVIATSPTSRDSLRTLHEELAALPSPALPEPIALKAEQAKARAAASEAQAAARLEAAARNDARKAEHEQARKAAVDAQAAARLEEAARKVEEARRKYEGLTKKPA
jgi:hypothetical protein